MTTSPFHPQSKLSFSEAWAQHLPFLIIPSWYTSHSLPSSADCSGASLSHCLTTPSHVSRNLTLFLINCIWFGGLGVAGLYSKSSTFSSFSIISLGFIPFTTAVATGAGAGEAVLGANVSEQVVGVVLDWVDRVVRGVLDRVNQVVGVVLD